MPEKTPFPPGMGTLARVLRAWGTALRLGLRHIHVVLALSLVGALLTAPVDAWLYRRMSGPVPHQEDLLRVMLAWSGTALAAEFLYGPLFAAAAVYLVAAWAEDRRDAGLYRAVNFALSRYGRVFLPHLGAQLSIQLGMLVVIPGIYFLTMYAFVDPVAALEKRRWAMDRSKKLTRGRRRSVLLVALPAIAVAMFRMFADLAALARGTGWFVLDYAFFFALQFLTTMAFTWLYLERTTARGRKRKAGAGAEAAPPAVAGAGRADAVPAGAGADAEG